MNFSGSDKRLVDEYFRRLEVCLRATSAADRSRIVADVYQILTAEFEKGSRPVGTILSEIGNPIEVARNYRERYGLVSRPTKLFSRGLTVFFLFCFLLCAFVGFIGFGLFSERAPLLGYLQSHFFPKTFEWHVYRTQNYYDDQVDANPPQDTQARAQTNGSFDAKGISEIRILNYTGGLTFESVPGSELRYSCEGVTSDNLVRTSSRTVTFQFPNVTENCVCHIKVPKMCHLFVQFKSGSIVLASPSNAVRIEGENGEILLKRAGDLEYKVDAKVEMGTVDGLNETDEASNEAIPVSLRLRSGSILVE